MSEQGSTATVESSLRLGSGFEAKERHFVVETLGNLDRRLSAFPEDAVEMSLSVKERETSSQRVVLEARVAHEGHFVVTSHKHDIDAALHEVRDELARQLTEARHRHEPGHARDLRDTIRHE